MTTQNSIAFRALPLGSWFEFDRSGLPLSHGLESGPWQKISARQYEKGGPRAMRCRIGSISVRVIPCARPIATSPADMLASTFGAEWEALSDSDRALIVRDCTTDGGVDDFAEYRRNIGPGNLGAYALTQRARFRRVDSRHD